MATVQDRYGQLIVWAVGEARRRRVTDQARPAKVPPSRYGAARPASSPVSAGPAERRLAAGAEAVEDLLRGPVPQERAGLVVPALGDAFRRAASRPQTRRRRLQDHPMSH